MQHPGVGTGMMGQHCSSKMYCLQTGSLGRAAATSPRPSWMVFYFLRHALTTPCAVYSPVCCVLFCYLAPTITHSGKQTPSEKYLHPDRHLWIRAVLSTPLSKVRTVTVTEQSQLLSSHSPPWLRTCIPNSYVTALLCELFSHFDIAARRPSWMLSLCLLLLL